MNLSDQDIGLGLVIAKCMCCGNQRKVHKMMNACSYSLIANYGCEKCQGISPKNNDADLEETRMIKSVYDEGYLTRQKERDYDPMGSEVVCVAIEKWERFERLARSVADGNFNQSEVIKEAKELSA